MKTTGAPLKYSKAKTRVQNVRALIDSFPSTAKARSFIEEFNTRVFTSQNEFTIKPAAEQSKT
jgi:hypothetical protein